MADGPGLRRTHQDRVQRARKEKMGRFAANPAVEERCLLSSLENYPIRNHSELYCHAARRPRNVSHSSIRGIAWHLWAVVNHVINAAPRRHPSVPISEMSRLIRGCQFRNAIDSVRHIAFPCDGV